MKARRIAVTRRIGDDATPRTPRDREDVNLIWFSLIGVVVVIIVFTIGLRFSDSRDIVRVTATATSASTQTVLPTATLTPTVLPTTPTPSPTIALEHGVMLAQVWLYDAPGGEKLSAGLLAGQEVTILERRDEFAKVRWEGEGTALVGWVAEKWIDRDEWR